MPDDFKDHAPGLTSPASKAYEITPDDDNDLPVHTRGIYVGLAGNLTVILQGDTTQVTFVGVPVGIMPIRVKRVMATGTAAEDLVGLI